MITVAILDTNGIEKGFSAEYISAAILERVEKTKNAAERKLRLGAYSLLGVLYREMTNDFSATMPTVLYTENGKPYFEKQNIKNEKNLKNDTPPINFNISHSGSLAAVAICGEDISVGVDVQKETRRGVLERIAARFFVPFRSERNKDASFPLEERVKNNVASDTECVNYRYFIIKEGNVVELEKDEGEKHFGVKSSSADSADEELLLKWSILEASLKMSGGGFADYPEADKIIDSTKTDTRIITHGKCKYALAVAYSK